MLMDPFGLNPWPKKEKKMIMDEKTIAFEIERDHKACYALGVKVLGTLDEKTRCALAAKEGANRRERGSVKRALLAKLYTLSVSGEGLGVDRLRAACAVRQFSTSLALFARSVAIRRDMDFVPHTIELLEDRVQVFGETLGWYDRITARISADIGTDEETAEAVLKGIVKVVRTHIYPNALAPYEVDLKNGVVYLVLDPKP